MIRGSAVPAAFRHSSPVTRHFSGVSRREHDDAHAGDGHRCADQVPDGRAYSVNRPEPDDRGGDIDPTVRGVNAAGSGGMERQQPDEQRERRRRGQQHPRRRALRQPQVRQVAADDLRNRGGDKKGEGLELKHDKSALRRSKNDSDPIEAHTVFLHDGSNRLNALAL